LRAKEYQMFIWNNYSRKVYIIRREHVFMMSEEQRRGVRAVTLKKMKSR